MKEKRGGGKIIHFKLGYTFMPDIQGIVSFTTNIVNWSNHVPK